MNRSLALLLTVVLATLMSWHSGVYYFHHPLYEVGDTAANSLAVDHAKHFATLYGPYSRWGFHHPGPAFFYVQALGEYLFFDLLHVVPAPFNGQALICLFVEVGFFFAAVQVFTQWLPGRTRWWFLPAAIALAALVFRNPDPGHSAAALAAADAFQTTWSADLVVLIFLCLLTAGASVAAGRGEDLPLLVLAGGCLVHLHVAQPLFVIPCTLLGYAGLIGSSVGRPADDYGPPRPWRRRALGAITAPWRRHRGAHVVAGVLLLLFLLPLAVDLTHGWESNVAAIFHYLRSDRGAHASLAKSCVYFWQFGTQATYAAGQSDFGGFSSGRTWHYCKVHAALLSAWLVVFALAASVVVRPLWLWSKNRPLAPAERFLFWAGLYLYLSVALTLEWGTRQAGLMYYFNAFFNFAIFYFAALIAAAVVIRLLLAASGWGERNFGLLERSAAILATLLCIACFIKGSKLVDRGWETHLATHERLTQALAQSAAPAAVKFLDFPQSTWPLAIAMALQIERAGEKFAVADQWRTMFGPEYPPRADLAQVAQTRYQKWSLVEEVPADKESAAKRWINLESGISLTTDQSPALDVDHAGPATLDFHINVLSPAIKMAGWSDPEFWGEWISHRQAVLSVPAAPVSEDVEMKLNVFPWLDPAHGVAAQRLRVSVNGEPVGPELRLAMPDQPPIELIIPRAIWNRLETKAGRNIMLAFDLPDAISAHELDPTGSSDTRAYALGVRRISFQAMKPAPPESLPPAWPAANDSAAFGAAPSEYRFDGSPISPAFCQGISEDGWAGAQATVIIPRTAAAAPFLRLKGVAVRSPGITYPYRFDVKAGSAEVTELTIPAPGPFDLLVPLPATSTAENITVHLSFSQTFALAAQEGNPNDRRVLSLLLHFLGVTSVDKPLFACFRQGWYGEEARSPDRWQWSDADSSVEVAAERSGTLEISGQVDTQAPDNTLDVLLDGVRFATLPLPKPVWGSLKLRVALSAGKHLLTFHSHLPGVQPPHDPRVLAFGLKNAAFTLL